MLHAIRLINFISLFLQNDSNAIKEFMEAAKTSLVSMVALAHGDALNDETPVSGGATSVGALKTAFYHSAENPILANKPKFLLLIGFVSGDKSEAKFNSFFNFCF